MFLDALRIISGSWPLAVAIVALCVAGAALGVVFIANRGITRRRRIDAEKELEAGRQKYLQLEHKPKSERGGSNAA